MSQLKTILVLTILAIMSGCSKENSATDEDDFCGTVETWSQNVTSNDLVGKWTIGDIYYSKGTGNTKLYDTSYTISAPLTLNANGTGTIYNTPLRWSFATSTNTLPKLTITQLDTLFTFPVGFIHNDTTDIYLQLPPTQMFYGKATKSGTLWESSNISFSRI